MLPEVISHKYFSSGLLRPLCQFNRSIVIQYSYTAT